jgi:hypothetical protein
MTSFLNWSMSRAALILFWMAIGLGLAQFVYALITEFKMQAQMLDTQVHIFAFDEVFLRSLLAGMNAAVYPFFGAALVARVDVWMHSKSLELAR